PPEPIGEPPSSLFEHLRVAGETQPEERRARTAKGGNGSQADARFINEAQRESARVILAVDSEEHVEAAVRFGEAHPASRAERGTNHVTSVPRALDLCCEERLAIRQRDGCGTLGEG